MIFWTGFGFLVPVLAWLGAGTVLGVMALLGINLSNKDAIVVPGAFILGGVYTFLFYKYVLAKREVPQELLDPKTGQKVLFRRSNSLFFVPFKYWPYVLATIGLIALAYHLTQS